MHKHTKKHTNARTHCEAARKVMMPLWPAFCSRLSPRYTMSWARKYFTICVHVCVCVCKVLDLIEISCFCDFAAETNKKYKNAFISRLLLSFWPGFVANNTLFNQSPALPSQQSSLLERTFFSLSPMHYFPASSFVMPLKGSRSLAAFVTFLWQRIVEATAAVNLILPTSGNNVTEKVQKNAQQQ